jgi:hypothetical protein
VGVTAVLRPVVAGIDGSPAALSVATAAARQARRALRPSAWSRPSPEGPHVPRQPKAGPARVRRPAGGGLQHGPIGGTGDPPAGRPARGARRRGAARRVADGSPARPRFGGHRRTPGARPGRGSGRPAAVCPALLERPIPTGARGVVVGVDCGPGTDALLAAAMTEACLRSTSLLVVHAWGRRADGDRHAPSDGAVAESERRLVDQHVLPFRQTPSRRPRHRPRRPRGGAAVLLAASSTAELVVVGRCDIGRGVPHDTIGPVATRSAAPVLVVPVGAAVPEPDRQHARRTAVALSR